MNTDHRISAVLALRKARRVAVFTGAGISAESGVPTFRDTDGFWRRFPPEQFATWPGLVRNATKQPRLLVEFVHHVIEPIASAKPNAAHRAVAKLAEYVSTAVITQNVDGLHQDAGSSEVHEIHGSLLEFRHVLNSRIKHRHSRADLANLAARLHQCALRKTSLLGLGAYVGSRYLFGWRGPYRPNLVLFGDRLAEPAWARSCQLVEECDVLLTIGTSGEVYPAAELPSQALAAGATVISIDPRPSVGCWLKGEAGTVLPSLVHDAFDPTEKAG